MAYNLTNVTDSRNLYDIVFHLNQASGYVMFSVFFFVLWIIIFITWHKFEQDVKKTLLFSSTIMSIIGIGLQALDLIGYKIVIIPVLGVIGGFLLVFFGD